MSPFFSALIFCQIMGFVPVENTISCVLRQISCHILFRNSGRRNLLQKYASIRVKMCTEKYKNIEKPKRDRMIRYRKRVVIPMIFLLLAVFVSGLIRTSANASSKANQQEIFTYLTKKMELPAAAACGILANIQYESSFNPHAVGDHGTSYGICQWHKSRFTALRSFCERKGSDYRTLSGQLDFLAYELKHDYGRIYRYMKEVSNDAYGAYQAGYYWCYHFERPAKYLTSSVKRGNTARDKYWPKYESFVVKDGTQAAEKPPVGEEIRISKTAVAGERLPVSGRVVSDGKLLKVTVGICRIDGTAVNTAVRKPEGAEADLSSMQQELHTADLEAGAYIVEITAANAAGTELLARQAVTILPRSCTYSSANVRFRLADDSSWFLGAAGTEDPAVQMTGKERDGNLDFQIVQQPNGCYSIRSLSVNRYMTLASDGRIVLEAWRGGSTQMWYLLPAGGKLMMLVPREADTQALTVAGKAAQGASVIGEDASLSERQLFRILKTENDTAILNPGKGASSAPLLQVAETEMILVPGTGTAAIHAASNTDISYESLDPDVVSVDAFGVLTIRDCGETEIKVTASRSGWEDRTETVRIRVVPAIEPLEKVIGLPMEG